MHRPNWLKFTTWPAEAPAAPAPTEASGENVSTLSYPCLHFDALAVPRITKLPGVLGFCTLRQYPSSVLPSAVPSKLAESLMLHCCCGFVVLAHGWNSTTAPDVCGVPASRHMPSGSAGVLDATSTS